LRVIERPPFMTVLIVELLITLLAILKTVCSKVVDQDSLAWSELVISKEWFQTIVNAKLHYLEAATCRQLYVNGCKLRQPVYLSPEL
jgi:hypothetical protein